MIKTCLFGTVIVQTVEFVTTNMLSKQGMRKNTRGCPKDHICYWKAEWDPKWNRTEGSVSVHHTFHLRVITLGSLGRIVHKPSLHDSLLLRRVARWTPRHERHWCTISRRDSSHRPSQVVVSELWITRVRRSDWFTQPMNVPYYWPTVWTQVLSPLWSP